MSALMKKIKDKKVDKQTDEWGLEKRDRRVVNPIKALRS